MTATDRYAALAGYSSATVTDAVRRLGVVAQWSEGVYPVSRGTRFAGPALTLGPASYATSAVNIYDLLFSREVAGAVLLLAGMGAPTWFTGANQCRAAASRGIVALLVDGSVRDSSELSALGLPVFARGFSARPYSADHALGAVDVDVPFAGMSVAAGSVVCGDQDGVVVFDESDLDRVLHQAEDIVEIESEQASAFASGLSLDEIKHFNVRKKRLRP